MTSQSSENIHSEIYLPSIGRSNHDLRKRIQLLQDLNSLKTKTGLMLLLLSQEDLEEKAIKKVLSNLKIFAKEQKQLKIFFMHPNKPLSGKKRLNFLDNSDWSMKYVKKSIDLCFSIQEEINSDWGKLLTFHLNTLIPPSLWRNDKQYWDNQFLKVYENLKDLSDYANSKKVTLAVETTPIPEFGDIAAEQNNYLHDYKCYWPDLGNPWPLFFWRDEISMLRKAGYSIVIDWSHSYIALSTLKNLGKLKDKEKVIKKYMIYQTDIELAKSFKSFVDLICNDTEKGDVWHVNNSRGSYKYKDIYGKEEIFYEGVSLDEGEISGKEINELLTWGLDNKIKIVIEVNETDFNKNENTKKSLEVIRKIISSKFSQSNRRFF